MIIEKPVRKMKLVQRLPKDIQKERARVIRAARGLPKVALEQYLARLERVSRYANYD